MKKFLWLLITGMFFTLPVSMVAQQLEKLDTAAISKIKAEGFNHSQVMNILSMLTDVHGPRLTNSPGYKKAAEYAKSALESFGVENVHFDNWDEEFGRSWELKKFSLQSLEPVYFPVVSYPKAWSPGIKGTVQAVAVYLDIKKEEDLNKYAGKLKGKIVLFSVPSSVKIGYPAGSTRLHDSTLLQMANAAIEPVAERRPSRSGQDAQRLIYRKWELCQKEGVIAVLEASPGYENSGLLVSGVTIPYPPETPNNNRLRPQNPNAPKILPQIVIDATHYNRMIRQLQKGVEVKLELTLQTEFTAPSAGFNVIGEIPGTDLKDEVVMIGAHLDSWHGATGTTDNAAGSSVMMEAMRILKSLGTAPRRTVRIGLWGGEEQGLLGSRSYVKRTFGERFDKSFPYDSIKLTPAAEKFSIYFNMDNGTGKYRGVYMQGNENAYPVFRSWLKPFEKLGSSTLTLRNTTGTDHLSFDAIGLPAFQFIQDPIEYGTRTHHTTMDIYDKAVESDLKHNAVMTAVFAWLAANRDEKFPRK
jgi:hypothetical protein